jgi:hypothetical protein
MVEISEAGDKVKKDWKSKVARATGGNHKLDKKVLRLKSSWDEVQGLLNKSVKKKKK